MVVFATYRIPWSGSSYTLQPRGRLARTKAPTDSPTSLGWLPWFRISYLKAACNLKWLRDGSTSTPSTLSWQSFHATAHRLLWEKGPWWRSTGCWRTWWQHLCIHLHPSTKISLKSRNHYLKLQMIMFIYWCKFIQRRHLQASKPDAFLGRPANCKASKSGMLETIMQRCFTSQPQSTYSAFPYFPCVYPHFISICSKCYRKFYTQISQVFHCKPQELP